MNTQTHLMLGLVAFARRPRTRDGADAVRAADGVGPDGSSGSSSRGVEIGLLLAALSYAGVALYRSLQFGGGVTADGG